MDYRAINQRIWEIEQAISDGEIVGADLLYWNAQLDQLYFQLRRCENI